MAKRRGRRQMPDHMSLRKHRRSGKATKSPKMRLYLKQLADTRRPRSAMNQDDVNRLYGVHQHHSDVNSGAGPEADHGR